MKKILPVIILFFVITACQDINRTPKPDDLIPENKMVDVLTELSLLHGARSYNKNLMEEKGIDPYPYLLNKFDIDSLQLQRSNDYYTQNYRQYERIYEKVKIRLEVLMQEYDSIREVEEKRQDSIRKLAKPDSLRVKESDSLLQDTVVRNFPDPVSISRERRRLPNDTVR